MDTPAHGGGGGETTTYYLLLLAVGGKALGQQGAVLQQHFGDGLSKHKQGTSETKNRKSKYFRTNNVSANIDGGRNTIPQVIPAPGGL